MGPSRQTADIRQDQAFFGRREELFRVVKNLREGRHTLLVGPYGIGKSSLMSEARALLTGAKSRVDFHPGSSPVARNRVLTAANPAPLGDFLREIAGGLFRNGDLRVESADERDDWTLQKKRFTQLGIQGMQSEVLAAIAGSGKNYILFVTNLERLSAGNVRFFETLLRITVFCGSALSTKDAPGFDCFWASFERVPLDRLPSAVAGQLVTHLMKQYPLNVVDPVMCRQEILSAAAGNPFHVKNLLHRAATRKSLGTREIREFRAVEEGPYFNMGPLYMIAAGVLTAVKFFSAGADKKEHYIYFSAIGFVLYLTFRVFRSFFVFRPRRKG